MSLLFVGLHSTTNPMSYYVSWSVADWVSTFMKFSRVASLFLLLQHQVSLLLKRAVHASNKYFSVGMDLSSSGENHCFRFWGFRFCSLVFFWARNCSGCFVPRSIPYSYYVFSGDARGNEYGVFLICYTIYISLDDVISVLITICLRRRRRKGDYDGYLYLLQIFLL